MDTLKNLERRLRCDYPTTEQLVAMNKWRPYGQPEYGEKEMLSVPILASTNMLRQDLTIWTEKTLRSMAATYSGESFILNHDWDDVRQSLGFVYDSEVIRIPAGGQATKEALLQYSINADIDDEVFDKQGFIGVICYAAVPAESSTAGAIRYRQLADVSTGGAMFDKQYICPLCGGDFGPEDEHYPPGSWSQFLVATGEIDQEMVAPFAWVDGWHESFELSFVTVGNVPQATIFVEDLIKLIYM